jgi:hypothetical protein
MNNTGHTLAERLGMIRHESPLRYKIRRLMTIFPAPACKCPEDWLVEVALARGVKGFIRDASLNQSFGAPSLISFSNEELIVGLCQTVALDRPQMLRMAAQFISRGDVKLDVLIGLIIMERAEVVIAELARAALKCDSNHAGWLCLAEAFPAPKSLKSPIVHWSRLAEPVQGRLGKIEHWKLAV